jgi:hypothetical protein
MILVVGENEFMVFTRCNGSDLVFSECYSDSDDTHEYFSASACMFSAATCIFMDYPYQQVVIRLSAQPLVHVVGLKLMLEYMEEELLKFWINIFSKSATVEEKVVYVMVVD